MSDHRPTVLRSTSRRLAHGAALALLPLVLLAGCGGDEASADPVPTTAAGTEAAATVPERLDVVATEYDWSGVPDRLPPGSYPLTLTNEGTEAHEIQVFKNTEGLSLDELFDLGADGAAHIEEAGGVLAGAGGSGEAVLELTEGTYEVVCYIPAPDGRPHFAHGMHRTLEVG